MSLKDQIMSDIKEAMKAKETLRLSTLRSLHSAIKNREIEVRPNDITEDDILGVIKKAVKQRKEAIEQYKAGNREDLVAQETSELEILDTYLPEQMTEEQLVPIVQAVIAEVGASSMKDMGKVMPAVLAKTGGAADGKLISNIVKSELS